MSVSDRTVCIQPIPNIPEGVSPKYYSFIKLLDGNPVIGQRCRIVVYEDIHTCYGLDTSPVVDWKCDGRNIHIQTQNSMYFGSIML